MLQVPRSSSPTTLETNFSVFGSSHRLTLYCIRFMALELRRRNPTQPGLWLNLLWSAYSIFRVKSCLQADPATTRNVHAQIYTTEGFWIEHLFFSNELVEHTVVWGSSETRSSELVNWCCLTWINGSNLFADHEHRLMSSNSCAKVLRRTTKEVDREGSTGHDLPVYTALFSAYFSLWIQKCTRITDASKGDEGWSHFGVRDAR